MSTNQPTSPSAASWRLLLSVFVGLTVLGIVLLGMLHRREADPSTPQGVHPVPATPGVTAIAEAKPSSPANSTVVTAPQSSAPAVLPPSSPAPTNAGSQPTPPIAATTPATPPSTPRAQAAVQDNSLVDPLSTETALAPGEAAHLRVTVGGAQTPLLSPNQIGMFPRVYIPRSGQADVQVQLPEAAVGDQVVASIEDGGRFSDGKPVESFTLDESRQVSFQFQASDSPGTFRVDIRHGAQTKVVAFWAGDRALAINH